MASASYERRNARARAAGYKNYYEQRLAKAKAKHGEHITTSQARGHATKGEIKLTTLSDVRGVLEAEGRQAAFRFAAENDLDITHDQWSLIFGSPVLRSHRRGA